MLPHERLELLDKLRAPAERELDVEALLQRDEPALVESSGRLRRKRLGEHVRERLPWPESERLAERSQGGRSVGGFPRRGDDALEAVEVELARLDPEQIARGAADDAVGPEHPAQLREVAVKRLRGAGWLPLSPEPLAQTITRDRRVGVEQQDGQQRALLRTAQRHGHAVAAYLDRSEDRELHCATVRIAAR